MTGGATAGDFDGDGWTDLFVTRSDSTDILYRNKGDGTFEDFSIAAGFSTQPPSLHTTNGAAAAGELQSPFLRTMTENFRIGSDPSAGHA